jgi:hypothetical protein
MKADEDQFSKNFGSIANDTDIFLVNGRPEVCQSYTFYAFVGNN